jgi:hypothetical protein
MTADVAPEAPKPAPGTKLIDLVRQCADARDKMSTTNPHRVLMQQCINAITMLADELDRANARRVREN